jgi:hypothetical protein
MFEGSNEGIHVARDSKKTERCAFCGVCCVGEVRYFFPRRYFQHKDGVLFYYCMLLNKYRVRCAAVCCGVLPIRQLSV